MSKLIDKHKRFCDEYLANGMNATEAYMSVYKGVKRESTAKTNASRLLTNANVKEYIAGNQSKIANKLELTSERLAQEYYRVAFGDVRKLFNADGSMKAIHELDDEAAAMISSFEVDELITGNGVTKKVKLWNKTTAMADIGKHLGFFEKDNGQKTPTMDMSNLTPEKKLQLLQLLGEVNATG